MGLQDCTQPLGPKAPAVLALLLQPSPPQILGTRQGKGFCCKSSGPALFQTPAKLALLANPPRAQPGPQQTPHRGPRPCHLLPKGSPRVLLLVVVAGTLRWPPRGVAPGAEPAPRAKGKKSGWPPPTPDTHPPTLLGEESHGPRPANLAPLTNPLGTTPCWGPRPW